VEMYCRNRHRSRR